MGRSLPQEEGTTAAGKASNGMMTAKHNESETKDAAAMARDGTTWTRCASAHKTAAPASEACRTSSFLEDQGEPVLLQKMTQTIFNVKEPFEHTNFDPVCFYQSLSAQSIVTKHTKQ